MAMKLTKEEKARHEAVTEAVRNAGARLDDAISELNEKLEVLRNDVILIEQEYNAALQEARAFAEEVAARIEGEIDGRSEHWQESEKGEQATAWHEQWADVDLEDIEVEYPQDIEEQPMPHADTLEELPQEAG